MIELALFLWRAISLAAAITGVILGLYVLRELFKDWRAARMPPPGTTETWPSHGRATVRLMIARDAVRNEGIRMVIQCAMAWTYVVGLSLGMHGDGNPLYLSRSFAAGFVSLALWANTCLNYRSRRSIIEEMERRR